MVVVLALLVVLCVAAPAVAVVECTNGQVHTASGTYACEGFDLVAEVSLSVLASAPGDEDCDIGEDGGSDMWGWTDPDTQDMYLLMGIYGCTGIVVVRGNTTTYLGFVPSYGKKSYWKDIKILDHYALIGSEANNYGMQILDLHTVVSRADDTPRQYAPTATYTAVQSSHNLAVNEDTKHVFILGTTGGDECGTGAHVVDMTNPLQPVKLACVAEGYIHDAQCVTYAGPDSRYVGREICFMCTGEGELYTGPSSLDKALLIYDMTNREVVSRTTYPDAQFSHQGWLTDDQAFFLLGDEWYELELDEPSTTIVFDVALLDAPVMKAVWQDEGVFAISHNLYIRGSLMFQADHEAGMRVRQFHPNATTASGYLTNVAHFDTYPPAGTLDYYGAWNVFPFTPGFQMVAVSDVVRGLFVLRPHEYVRELVVAAPANCSSTMPLSFLRSMPALWSHVGVCSGV